MRHKAYAQETGGLRAACFLCKRLANIELLIKDIYNKSIDTYGKLYYHLYVSKYMKQDPVSGPDVFLEAIN